MTFAIIAFICRWRPAHSKRRGGCAVGPFADALIILTVKHKQISTYLAVKHKQKCLPTGCSRGLNGSAFSRISTAVAQLRVGTQLQDRPSPPVQAHHASLHRLELQLQIRLANAVLDEVAALSGVLEPGGKQSQSDTSSSSSTASAHAHQKPMPVTIGPVIVNSQLSIAVAIRPVIVRTVIAAAICCMRPCCMRTATAMTTTAAAASTATAAAVHSSLPISCRLAAHWHAAAAQLTALLTIRHVMRPSLVVFIVFGRNLAIQGALRVGIHPNLALLARLLFVAVGGRTSPTLVAFGASKLSEHAVPLIATPRRQPHKANRRAARSDGEYVSVPTKNGDYVFMRDGRRFGAIFRNERHHASILRWRIA